MSEIFENSLKKMDEVGLSSSHPPLLLKLFSANGNHVEFPFDEDSKIQGNNFFDNYKCLKFQFFSFNFLQYMS